MTRLELGARLTGHVSSKHTHTNNAVSPESKLALAVQQSPTAGGPQTVSKSSGQWKGQGLQEEGRVPISQNPRWPHGYTQLAGFQPSPRAISGIRSMEKR